MGSWPTGLAPDRSERAFWGWGPAGGRDPRKLASRPHLPIRLVCWLQWGSFSLQHLVTGPLYVRTDIKYIEYVHI